MGNLSIKRILIICLSVAVGFIVGSAIASFLFSSSAEPMTFSDSGMSITLTSDFKEKELENYTVCFDSNKVAVMSLKESFSMVEGFEKYTLEEYGALVIETNKLASTELRDIDGLMGFDYEYTNPDSKKTYKYFSFVFKADDAFWIFQFAMETKYANDLEDDVIKWAKSIRFEAAKTEL